MKGWATGYRALWHAVKSVQDDGSANEAACGAMIVHHKVYPKPTPRTPRVGESLAIVAPRVCRACRKDAAAEPEKPATVYCCRECGCTDVDGQFWVSLNTIETIDGKGEVGALNNDCGDEYWCPQCEDSDAVVCHVDEDGKCSDCKAIHPLHEVRE